MSGLSKYHLFLILIILAAWLVRLHHLTYHSLWFDEAMSVHWARQTTPRILEVGFSLTEDRLPPLYYLMLKGWTSLFGFSETSLRSLSVLFGLLVVPITASIARLLFRRRIALFSAGLIALNPFLVWYSQEARMYAPALFFASLAIWTFLHWLDILNRFDTRPSHHLKSRQSSETGQTSTRSNCVFPTRNLGLRFTFYVLIFILTASAALYSHLYAGFLLPALGLWLLLSYPRAWRAWLTFAGSGFIILSLFAPIALAIWRFSGEAKAADLFTGLAQRTWWLLQAFILWKAPLPGSLQIAILITVILFACFAYLSPPRLTHNTLHTPHRGQPAPQDSPPRFNNPRLLVSLLLICPFLIANLLLLRNHLAFFGERYFIIMVPWLLLLAALGADTLGQWTTKLTTTPYLLPSTSYRSSHLFCGFITLALWIHRSSFITLALWVHHSPFIILLSLTALPLPGQWSIPASKEAWRQSVTYLADHAAADHAILIHPDWVRFPFQYYFQGPGHTYAAFSNVTPETVLDGPMQGVIDDHPVVWLIQSHLDAPDPQRRVEQWLAARYPLVTEQYPPGITLKGYAPGYQLKRLPPTATPVEIQFENGLRLAGYQADPSVTAADPLFHPPSGWLHVTLYWTAGQAIITDTRPFVHLVGPEGVWGVNLDRPADALSFYPPSQWSPPYPIIRHDLDVNLNPATPAGKYQLVVGLQGYQSQYPLTQIEVR